MIHRKFIPMIFIAVFLLCNLMTRNVLGRESDSAEAEFIAGTNPCGPSNPCGSGKTPFTYFSGEGCGGGGCSVLFGSPEIPEGMRVVIENVSILAVVSIPDSVLRVAINARSASPTGIQTTVTHLGVTTPRGDRQEGSDVHIFSGTTQIHHIGGSTPIDCFAGGDTGQEIMQMQCTISGYLEPVPQP